MLARPAAAATRDEIEALLDGLDLMPPGLMEFDDWWPDGPSMTPPAPTRSLGLAAIGTVP
ncbi:SAM-dependent methyltransferase [Amycolatopsis rubida]|nr:SAM-dependent methyltransferase [Amycolatopsis rubida]